MLPPIKTILQASADVRALLGARPRVYKFGEVPQGEAGSLYGVWQVVNASPENSLSEAPSIDRITIQFDLYGSTQSAVEEAGKACRTALEGEAHCIAWRAPPRDPETRRFRISFDFDFWHRPE